MTEALINLGIVVVSVVGAFLILWGILGLIMPSRPPSDPDQPKGN